MSDNFDVMEVSEDSALDQITVEEQASDFSMDAIDSLVVEEEAKDDKLPGSDVVIIEEEQAAKDTDWANDKDHSKFLSYLEDRVGKIPRHSGSTIPGCERAVSYCKDLQNELSKAMRGDLDGKIDEQKADHMYKDLSDKIERLETQIDKLRAGTPHKIFASPKTRLISEDKCDKCNCNTPTWHDIENDRVVCLKCEAELGSENIEKFANTPVINVYVTAFERACVGTMINAACSNGKNIEDIYGELDKKYKFTDREKLSLRQLLSDYGYPQLLDRAKVEDNDGNNNGELAQNFNA